MKVAHLFVGGNIGGIECLCRDYTKESQHEHIFIVLWDDTPVLREIESNGIKLFYLNLSHKSVIKGYHEVLRICNAEQVDVLIAEHEAILSHIIIWRLRNHSIKTIVYAHCHASFMCREKEKHDLFIRKRILVNSMKSAYAVIAISESVKNSLVSYFGVSKDKVRVIYNGVIFPEINEKKSLCRDYHRIVYIGRLIEDKGVQTIIKALKLLGQDYHLDIVGDGPYRAQLEEFCAGYEKQFSFHGYQRDVYKYLENAAIFIHVPDCEEGFGLTVAEAMAAGNVCIVGDKGALPELIDDGIDGVMVSSGNVEELARKICFVAEEAENQQLDQIRKNAVEKSKEYSMEKYTEMVDSMLAEITKGVLN